MRLFNFYGLSVVFLAVLTGCQTTGSQQAPVVERQISSATRTDTQSSLPQVITSTPAVAKPTPSSQTNSAAAPHAAVSQVAPVIIPGKQYLVKRGDTLYSIALEFGLSYRDIASWNQIANPNYIQADQVLRLTPPDTIANTPLPVAESAVAVASPIPAPTPSVVVQTSPATTPSGTIKPSASGVTPTTGNTATGAVVVTNNSTSSDPQSASTSTATDVVWAWPVKGKVTEAYVEGKNKGVAIAGALGEQILAAADGKVIYANNALKGYGNMVIIKHNETYITAYAHNSKLMVKEEQTVRRGQVIAEMGNSDSEGGKVKLHFELRRNGKPLDPTKLLPTR